MTLQRKIEFILRNNLPQEAEAQMEKLVRIVAMGYADYVLKSVDEDSDPEILERKLNEYLNK